MNDVARKSNRETMMLLLRWFPAIVWMIVIFGFSHQTGEQIEHSFQIWIHSWIPFVESANIGHFFAYFILSLTIYYGLGKKFSNIKGRILVVILCVVYGLFDEFHQSFVPGRSPDAVDLRNDAIGAALAMLFVSIPPVHRLFIRISRGKRFQIVSEGDPHRK